MTSFTVPTIFDLIILSVHVYLLSFDDLQTDLKEASPAFCPAVTTSTPTSSPTKVPTTAPVAPTDSPITVTSSPTKSPSLAPAFITDSPITNSPTKSPSLAPVVTTDSPVSSSPTKSPSLAPVPDPTKEPTLAPTPSQAKNVSILTIICRNQAYEVVLLSNISRLFPNLFSIFSSQPKRRRHLPLLSAKQQRAKRVKARRAANQTLLQRLSKK